MLDMPSMKQIYIPDMPVLMWNKHMNNSEYERLHDFYGIYGWQNMSYDGEFYMPQSWLLYRFTRRIVAFADVQLTKQNKAKKKNKNKTKQTNKNSFASMSTTTVLFHA